MNGKLFVVATPIGNLGDLTTRAVETLKSVDLIACEDTRVTLKLLNYLKIKKPLLSYHQHSKLSRVEEIVSQLIEGKSVAMVSDAGTPGLSDPGRELVSNSIKKGIEVVPIPGPSALSTMLSVSDMHLHEFIFIGFLPHKKGRQTKLKEMAIETRPIILFESVHRIKKLLNEIEEYCGDCYVNVGRELTKKFEIIYRGPVSRVKEELTEKGSFIVIIEGDKK